MLRFFVASILLVKRQLGEGNHPAEPALPTDRAAYPNCDADRYSIARFDPSGPDVEGLLLCGQSKR